MKWNLQQIALKTILVSLRVLQMSKEWERSLRTGELGELCGEVLCRIGWEVES